MFDGLDVNQAVDWFTTLFLSVIARHVPNREIICSDRDAPWITNDVNKLSNVNIVCIYRRYVKRGRKPEDWTGIKQVKKMQLKWLLTQKTNIIIGLAKSFLTQMWA